MLIFNGIIKYFQKGQLTITISALIGIKTCSFTNIKVIIDAISSLIAMVLMMVWPFLQFYSLYRLRIRVTRDQRFREKIKSLFEGLQFEKPRAFFFSSLMLLRKTFLAIIIVFSLEGTSI